MVNGYIPQKDRKKIILLCDDLRMHSGIATMAREFVTGTAHKYNCVQMAGSGSIPRKERFSTWMARPTPLPVSRTPTCGYIL